MTPLLAYLAPLGFAPLLALTGLLVLSRREADPRDRTAVADPGGDGRLGGGQHDPGARRRSMCPRSRATTTCTSRAWSPVPRPGQVDGAGGIHCGGDAHHPAAMAVCRCFRRVRALHDLVVLRHQLHRTRRRRRRARFIGLEHGAVDVDLARLVAGLGSACHLTTFAEAIS